MIAPAVRLPLAQRADDPLQHVIEMIDEPFVLFDSTDRMLVCNQRYREFNRAISDLLMPGMSFGEILEGGVARGLFPDAAGRECEFIDDMSARHAHPAGPFVVACSGERWIRIHERRLSDGRTVMVGTEITDRMRADREIMTLNAELERRVEQRTAELSAANRELEAFSYSIAHDLKAPLRAIGGFAEGLREGYAAGLDDAGRRDIARIIANAARMAEMIDDLLRLSRVTLSPLARKKLDLGLIARTVANEALGGYPRAQLRVADIPPTRADPGLLQQAYSNLIGNALKFSSKQQQPRVEIGAECRNGGMVYFVRDNGAGFNMDDARNLFGVFQRLHSPREFEGTGIGLAIVRRIVQRHGGRIWADAAPNAGATFYFTLESDRSSPAAST